MGKIRLWHASRDAYHCAFRFLRLLSIADQRRLELEWMRIFDLYLLYPPLLHRASMPQEVKAQFRELELPHPDRIFIRLPSAGAIFRDLRVYQNAAISQLMAKGVIGREPLKDGRLEFIDGAIPETLKARISLKNEADHRLLGFLLGPLSTIPLTGSDSIYRKAALPIRMLTK